MGNKKDAFMIASKANRVQCLIDNLNSRYYWDYQKRNHYLDAVVAKFKEVDGVVFFDNAHVTGLFIRFLYAYRLSGGLKNVNVFNKVLYKI